MSDLMDATEDEEEASVNTVVDATAIITPPIDEQPTMSPQVLWAFCVDSAQNIMPYREIALRYGFMDVPQLRDFLVGQEQIRKRIKELRAVWNSDENLETRVKTLAGHAVLAALPGTAQIMLNPRVPDNTRLDAMKEHAKIAGLTNNSWGKGSTSPGGPEGAKFSVNIMFQNAGKVETITTVSHEPDAITEEGEAA
jgi:hypothetical protein